MDGKKENGKALQIILICNLTYFVSYVLRRLLSVYNPELIASGYTATMTATFASVYMVVYALGQFLNGTIGDYVNPKYMVSLGMLVVSASLFAFSFVGSYAVQVICFGVLGFGLSMLRGPIVKLISENSNPKMARLGCTFISFISVVGTFVAGIVAILLAYKTAYITGAIVAFAFAVISFLVISLLEKQGKIVYKKSEKGKVSVKDILGVFKIDRFVYYLLFAVLVEISATSVTHWLTLYFTERLALSDATAKIVYSVSSLGNAVCSFICLALLKLLKDNDIKLMRFAYLLALALFVGVFFVHNAVVNILFLILALMSISVASSAIWSVYIPGLAKTGKVSSANGVMDCIGYFGAAGANLIFAVVKENLGWNGLVISWGIVALLGLIFALCGKSKRADQ